MGCVEYDNPNDFFDFPDSAKVHQVSDVLLSQAAWVAAGLPDPTSCDRLWIAEVDPIFFRANTGHDSCWDVLSSGCWYGATYHIQEGVPTMLYYRPPALPEGEPDRLIRHEIYHVWAYCGGLGMQLGHEDPRIWVDAMGAGL